MKCKKCGSTRTVVFSEAVYMVEFVSKNIYCRKCEKFDFTKFKKGRIVGGGKYRKLKYKREDKK